jgi:hypothetical protein
MDDYWQFALFTVQFSEVLALQLEFGWRENQPLCI